MQVDLINHFLNEFFVDGKKYPFIIKNTGTAILKKPFDVKVSSSTLLSKNILV